MKLAHTIMLAASFLATAPSHAQILGPEAARCSSAPGPAILVTIVGLKSRAGTVRVRTYGGDPSTWFAKGKSLTRVEVPIPASGPVRLCAPVPGPGTYAVEVRHDANRNDHTDRADGGGASGDPRVSIFSFMFGRKPSPDVTKVRVGARVTDISVTMMYLSGTSFKPISEIGQ